MVKAESHQTRGVLTTGALANCLRSLVHSHSRAGGVARAMTLAAATSITSGPAGRPEGEVTDKMHPAQGGDSNE